MSLGQVQECCCWIRNSNVTDAYIYCKCFNSSHINRLKWRSNWYFILFNPDKGIFALFCCIVENWRLAVIASARRFDEVVIWLYHEQYVVTWQCKMHVTASKIYHALFPKCTKFTLSCKGNSSLTSSEILQLKYIGLGNTNAEWQLARPQCILWNACILYVYKLNTTLQFNPSSVVPKRPHYVDDRRLCAMCASWQTQNVANLNLFKVPDACSIFPHGTVHR